MSRYAYNAMKAARAWLMELDESRKTNGPTDAPPDPIEVSLLTDACERAPTPLTLASTIELLDEAIALEEQIATLIAGPEKRP